MDYLGTIADVVGIIGAIFALFAWLKARQVQQEAQKERERQSRNITVSLQYGSERIELPVAIRRAELTRAEILGHIGMVRNPPGERFNLSYLSTQDFFRQLSIIMAGSGDAVLTIPCKQEEFEQFHPPTKP